MTKTLETTGATIDEAISEALKQLGLSRDDVTVEVLEKPKAGFFGIGASEAKVRVSFFEPEIKNSAEVFLTGLLDRMKVPAKINIKNEDDENVSIEISGDRMGFLIGRRGDTLDAIQYITSLVVNKNAQKRVRVIIDTENYRDKRKESLERLARKIAGKVLKYKKSITLEPMNPYERHIIHSALQEYKGVSTHSIGSEPSRRVIVTIASLQKNQPRDRRP